MDQDNLKSSDVPCKTYIVLDNVDNILQYLKNKRLYNLANDLEYKKYIIEQDDDIPISIESARTFACFVTTEVLPGSPNATVDYCGYVGLEWIIPGQITSKSKTNITATNNHVWGKGNGVLGLWFLPNRLVKICGTSGPAEQGIKRMRINSVSPIANVINEIQPFLSRLHYT